MYKKTINVQEARCNCNRNDLAFARTSRKLLPKRAAKIIGVKPTTLLSYESGKRRPRLETALKLEILYRTQLGALYQPLYAKLTDEIRHAEGAEGWKGGAR